MLHTEQNNLLIKRVERLSKLFAQISIAVGVIVLFGWAFNIQFLKSILPWLVSMKANTAVGFILLGFALVFNQNNKYGRLSSTVLTTIVLLLGLLTLSQYLFNINLGIDQFIFLDNSAAKQNSNPGRMPFATTVIFILLSFALILFRSRFWQLAAQVITLCAVAIGSISLIGYAYGIPTLLQINTHTLMALHTSILFILISLSILFTKPQVGIMPILVSRNVGSVMIRRILPVIVGLPILIGLIHVVSKNFVLFPSGIGEAILDVIAVAVISFLILRIVNSFNNVDVERKWAEEELKKQNSAFDAITNNSHSIIIFLLDKNYRYLAFNKNHIKEMKKVYDVDIEIGMNLLDLITIPEVRVKAKASIDRVLNGETFVETEIQPNLNIYYEFHWNIVRKDEKIIGASCFIIDITERKLVEKALEEAEEKFRTVFENTVVGLYRTTLDGQIILANPALIEMLGFNSFDELARRNLEENGFEPNYSRIAFKEQIEKEGSINGLEFAWEKADGSTIYIRESAKAIKDETGNTIYYEGAVEDITEHKLAEKALQKSEARYKQFFDEDLTGDFVSTLDGKILMCNQSFADILKYKSKEEVLKINGRDLYWEPGARKNFINRLKTEKK